MNPHPLTTVRRGTIADLPWLAQTQIELAQLMQDEAERRAEEVEHLNREGDRIAAFCVSGRGHEAIIRDEVDPTSGRLVSAYCDDCSTVLS